VADLFGAPAVATQPPDARPVGERRVRDAYYTPDALALAICDRVAHLPGLGRDPEYILEPGCGGGAFLRAARATWPRAHLLGIDIAPACDGPGLVREIDFFDPGLSAGCYDLLVGNPPFDMAERFVRRSLELMRTGDVLAFLLRISFLASVSRVALYREHPLWAFAPIAGRPSFTGGGADTSEYGLFVWAKGRTGPGLLLEPLVWRGRDPSRAQPRAAPSKINSGVAGLSDPEEAA
jgi:hypothetical protein